jgi:hypothetical protein
LLRADVFFVVGFFLLSDAMFHLKE